MLAQTNRKIILATTGGLGLFAFVSILALWSIERFVSDSAGVTHSYQVRSELQSFDDFVREAKSSVRSYLLTRDSGYITRYRSAKDSLEHRFKRLQDLVSDNSTQSRRLELMRPVLEVRLRSFESAFELSAADVLNRSDTLTRTLQRGEALSRRLEASVAVMDDEERFLLARRAEAQRESKKLVQLVIVLTAALGVVAALVLHRAIERDLELRAKAEAAIRESEAKFKGILSIAADAIITADAHRTILHFNRGAERVFGYSAHEVIGQPLDQLIPHRFASSHATHMVRFAAGPQESREMGHRDIVLGRRKNGEEFSADVSISRLHTSSGLLYTAVLRDVTEQKRRERQEHVLADAGRRLAGTMSDDTVLHEVVALTVPELGDWSMLDVVDDLDAKRPTFRRVLSHHENPEIDAALRAIQARGLTDDSPSRVLDVLRSGRGELHSDVSEDWLESHTEPDELPLLRAAGIGSLMFMPLTAGDRTIGVLTIGRRATRGAWDASDTTLAEALAERAALAIDNSRNFMRARRATRARDEVLAVVSHDLRNSLSGVTISARTLLEHPESDDNTRAQLASTILEGATWMHRLIQDLLDVSSIEAGRLSVTREPQASHDLVDSSIHLLAAHAQQYGVSLGADAARDLPLVNADGGRIVQALGNLIGNAIKYSHSGDTVAVGAAARGTEVVFWVKDTGAGISPEHLPRIFERFWHMQGSSRVRGSGLGLAIVKGIITAHGGRIWVESALGKGSTFWFTLPVSHRVTLASEPANSERSRSA